MRANSPNAPLAWDLPNAALEFGLTVQTLRNRLNACGAIPDTDDCYTTQQLIESQFGSKYVADLKYTLAQTEGIELKNAAM